MDQVSTGNFPVTRVTADSSVSARDVLAVEEPLEIRLAGPVERPVSITMRTPGNDAELAVGFLFTENIINGSGDIKAIMQSSFDENKITVELSPSKTPDLKGLDRNFYTTSSCGVCGKASVDAVRIASKYNTGENVFTVLQSLLQSLPDKLRSSQKVFDATGALHASGLFDLKGNLLMLREDVGRHNALDKVIGACVVQNRIPLRDTVLLLSGRISFELVQKASVAGIAFVAAIGAPSTLAVEVAKECGITLVGFLRDNRYTIYTGGERIQSL